MSSQDKVEKQTFTEIIDQHLADLRGRVTVDVLKDKVNGEKAELSLLLQDLARYRSFILDEPVTIRCFCPEEIGRIKQIAEHLPAIQGVPSVELRPFILQSFAEVRAQCETCLRHTCRKREGNRLRKDDGLD